MFFFRLLTFFGIILMLAATAGAGLILFTPDKRPVELHFITWNNATWYLACANPPELISASVADVTVPFRKLDADDQRAVSDYCTANKSVDS